MTGGHRTLVLGFDALDDEYLDRFADETEHFQTLRTDGVHAPLESTQPPWTASAWPSMYTGTDPSHHGVYGFFDYDYPDDGEIVSRNDVDAPALWNYLTRNGVPSVVMNLPVTHPAESIEGAVIPGYLAGEDAPGTPTGIRETISDAIGEEYRIYSRGEIAADPAEKLQGYLELLDLRKRAAVELLTTREWELGVIQVQKTDAVFHNFDDEAAFRAVYGAADDFLGAVLRAVGDDVNVIVCSDHGMGRKDGFQIQLNDVLRSAGYLTAAEDGRAVSLGTEKTRLLAEEDDPTSDEEPSISPVERGVSAAEWALSKVGITPGRVYGLAESLGVERVLVEALPSSVTKAAGEGVDWRASRAYCRSASRMGVRINLAGREPAGVVSQAEYERLRDRLVALLEGLETPDGQPAFESVKPREAVYDGPNVEDAPDVVVRPTGDNHVLSTNLYGRDFLPADVYDHDPTGVFIGHGPGIDHDATPGTLSLTDVAPIAMALLGQPVPARMTGTIPAGLLTGSFERADYGTVPYGTGDVVDEAREEVTDALAELGYI